MRPSPACLHRKKVGQIGNSGWWQANQERVSGKGIVIGCKCGIGYTGVSVYISMEIRCKIT